MLISHRHRFIFVHVQKTGGTSVTAALYRFCDQEAIDQARRGGLLVHSTAQDIIRVFGREVWDSYFTFAFERNPWDKTLSMYYANLESGYNKILRPRKPSFRQWMYPFGIWPKKLKPSIDLYSLDGQVAVDYLGRYERLHEDFAAICQRIGLEGVDLPHRNPSQLRNDAKYREHYTPWLRRRVEQVYAREIDALQYAF